MCLNWTLDGPQAASSFCFVPHLRKCLYHPSFTLLFRPNTSKLSMIFYHPPSGKQYVLKLYSKGILTQTFFYYLSLGCLFLPSLCDHLLPVSPLSVCSTCCDTVLQRGGFNTIHFFSLGGWKFEIGVSALLVSPKAFSWACRCCFLHVPSHGRPSVCVSVLIS